MSVQQRVFKVRRIGTRGLLAFLLSAPALIGLCAAETPTPGESIALTKGADASVGKEALFAEDSDLSITLAAPLSQTQSERDKSAVYPGEVRWEARSFPVEITLRGNRRLSRKVCAYPPLRLEFGKKTTEGSIFDGQTDLKLVVQCRDGELYADYLRTEFLIYKAMNVLTPLSYEARWVNVTYIDTDGRMTERTEGAFFTERKGQLAKRNGRRSVDVMRIDISELDPASAALVNLFQFLIANPDYSLVAAAPGEECCHNAKLLSGPVDGRYTPLIYDFDSAGLINAKYALPPKVLNIKRVTDRLYMGYCEQNEALAEARSRLLEAQGEITRLFADDPLLSASMKSRVQDFLGKGFEILADAERFERNIVKRCRG